MLTAPLVQDQEFVYPFYRLQEAGYEVDVAAPDGAAEIRGFAGVKINPTRPMPIPLAVELAPYRLVVIPGGVKAMEVLRLNRSAVEFIAAFHAAGKPVAAICSGVQMLISAKLVRGRHVSGYYAIKDDIENAGGTFVDAPAVVDDGLITSPHYRHLGAWMAAALVAVAS